MYRIAAQVQYQTCLLLFLSASCNLLRYTTGNIHCPITTNACLLTSTPMQRHPYHCRRVSSSSCCMNTSAATRKPHDISSRAQILTAERHILLRPPSSLHPWHELYFATWVMAKLPIVIFSVAAHGQYCPADCRTSACTQTASQLGKKLEDMCLNFVMMHVSWHCHSTKTLSMSLSGMYVHFQPQKNTKAIVNVEQI